MGKITSTLNNWSEEKSTFKETSTNEGLISKWQSQVNVGSTVKQYLHQLSNHTRLKTETLPLEKAHYMKLGTSFHFFCASK
jgi:hypothetical protein